MTRKQLNALEGYLSVKNGLIKMREAAAAAPGKPVSVGSYYRTASQAKQNLRQALVTLLIGLWLGAVRLDDVKRMFELVGLGARELSDIDQERLVQVIDALLDRIVA